MKRLLWLLSFPFVLFETVAGRIVEPPIARQATREELRERRDILMGEIEKPQAGGMGG